MTQQCSRDDEAGRRNALAAALAARGLLTITEAWEHGHRLGFYEGGDGSVAKDDLNAVGRRHDGFWRYRPDDPRRESARRWSDYWTPRASTRLYECRFNRAIYAQPCDRCDGTCAAASTENELCDCGKRDARDVHALDCPKNPVSDAFAKSRKLSLQEER